MRSTFPAKEHMSRDHAAVPVWYAGNAFGLDTSDDHKTCLRKATKWDRMRRRGSLAIGVVVLCLCSLGMMAPMRGSRASAISADAVSADGEKLSEAVPGRHLVEMIIQDVIDEGEGEGETTPTQGEEPVNCSPLHVAGLEFCSGWRGENIVASLLSLKREMLRSVLKVLKDPASSGEGGDPAQPLLLVQELAIDEADAVTGASTPWYLGKATDAGAWSPELGGMNRWLARYHREALDSTRPVLVEVHGDDTCALEVEISRDARLLAIEGSKYGDHDEDETVRAAKRASLELEDFDVPLVLMTVGWDPAGDPTHSWRSAGRDVNCAIRMLNLPRVQTWLTSHTQSDSHAHPKMQYMPIGFGGIDTRNGLVQSVYAEKAEQRLRMMEECELNMVGRYDLLFECNTMERKPRTEIWVNMTLHDEQPVPVNHCPLPPSEMVGAASTGLFAVSPPGTGPDCFRHYEMMAEGNIVLVPDTSSLRSFMDGLPVFFMGGAEPWGGLTCDRLVEMASEVKIAMQEGRAGDRMGLAYEKLTHAYWRNHIRKTVLAAGGSSTDTPYVERRSTPLSSPRWDTHRRVGCYDRTMGEGNVAYLEEGDVSPSSCAAFCSNSEESRPGTGFFGITTDRKCWCGNEIGAFAMEQECDSPVPCAISSVDTTDAPDTPDGCLHDGDERSDVYVFGPPDKALEHTYYGCYSAHYRFLYHAEQKFEGASTPALCGGFCASLRYPFFGIHRTNWCRCGTMTRNAGSSLRDPAWVEGAEPYEEVTSFPDVCTAGLPWPGAHVGDPDFQCSLPCSGDVTMAGCGGEKAWDMYRLTNPCIIFDDCDDSDDALAGRNAGGGRLRGR